MKAVACRGLILSASWGARCLGQECATEYGSARDQYAASEADYYSARQSIAGLVAKAWFVAIEASAQNALASDMLSSANSLLSLADDRFRVGVGSEFDVSARHA